MKQNLRKNTQQAFTLIELLVVVLIIGILAAVAVPQYQKAVVKSRLATIKPLLATIKTAEEEYYLANGEYTNSWDNLSINMSSCQIAASTSSTVYCDNYFLIDPISYKSINNITGEGGVFPNVTAYYCPGKVSDWNQCFPNKVDFTYTVWFDHSDTPGKHECTGKTDLGKTICKGME